MNTTHRPAFAPQTRLPAFAASAFCTSLHQRATLDGLQVSPLSFDAWLAAGGDRRSRPRPNAA